MKSKAVLIAVTLFLYAILLVIRGGLHDISLFIVAGDRFVTRSDIWVMPGANGYDGQFYYRLALDPFNPSRVAHGVEIDAPAYRYQRIFYPFLVWLLSLGHQQLVPALMVLVNFAFLGVIAYASGVYVQSLGLVSLWGLLIPLYPGFIITFYGNLVEIVEIGTLLLGLVLLSRRRYAWATLFLSLSVLTRETALVLLFCLAMYSLVSNHIPKYVAAVPLFLSAIWQLVVRIACDEFSWTYGPGLVPPLSGIFQMDFHTRHVVELIFLLFFALLVAYALFRSHAAPYIKLAWIIYAALALFLPFTVWEKDTAFLRVLSEFYVLGLLVLIGAHSTVSRRVGAVPMPT